MRVDVRDRLVAAAEWELRENGNFVALVAAPLVVGGWFGPAMVRAVRVDGKPFVEIEVELVEAPA